MKSSLSLLPVVFGAACWLAVSPAGAAEAQPEGVLSLSASASIEVVQDLISVTLSTSREGADANAVQAQLKQALDAGLAEARQAARPGQVEVKTGNFALYPRYSNANPNRPAITGWQGSAQIVIEGRDMATIGQLTGRISSMTIAGVSYRLSREASERVEGELAAQAIGRYRAKAADYAKQFGFAGYTIREVALATSEPGQMPMPMMRMRAAAAPQAEALSTEPGRATVTATVNGTVQMR